MTCYRDSTHRTIDSLRFQQFVTTCNNRFYGYFTTILHTKTARKLLYFILDIVDLCLDSSKFVVVVVEKKK